MIDVRTKVTWYPDATKNKIAAMAEQRLRGACNLARRTIRKMIGTKAAVVTDARGRKRFIGSPPGTPPYKRTGRAYGAVGFDIEKRQVGFEVTGRISVDLHGLETRRDRFRRPALAPFRQNNSALIGRILEGRSPIPQYGGLGLAAGRVKPAKELKRRTRPAGSPAPGQIRS